MLSQPPKKEKIIALLVMRKKNLNILVFVLLNSFKKCNFAG